MRGQSIFQILYRPFQQPPTLSKQTPTLNNSESPELTKKDTTVYFIVIGLRLPLPVPLYSVPPLAPPCLTLTQGGFGDLDPAITACFYLFSHSHAVDLMKYFVENIETENSVNEDEKPDIKVKIEQLNESNDVKPNIKTEPNPDIKVKIEQLNESNDVKPNIKTEPNPDVKVKIEKQDEVIDQKPVKSESDAVGGVQVKIEKTDESFDEKPKFRNETAGDEMQTTDTISVRGEIAHTISVFDAD